jgi:MoaA/NifB/PqqE/SkfB family radical SAM enzyme
LDKDQQNKLTATSLYHTFKRFRTLQTHRISALPIVILMPHSACNCRCVMCDIWKDNKNLKQLNENDIRSLLDSLKKLGTRQVLMSGGEAMLNPKFFDLCRLLKQEGLRITVLSTGLTLKKNAEELLQCVDDVIVSIDGDKPTHDAIRNIPGAFDKLSEGVKYLKSLNSNFRISARTVINKLNFRIWPGIINSAKEIGIDQVSFLPADVSSQAFNREVVWTEQRQHEIALELTDLIDLRQIMDHLYLHHKNDFENDFIAESPLKLEKIYTYYRALHGLCDFPFKKCNAPWVSAVIEADGKVRPCFFHEAMGNIREGSFTDILNSSEAVGFRKELDMEKNETCKRCVCYLNLPATMNPD